MPAGRPRKEFDKKIFEKLCMFQCTRSEIASWFGFNVDTLNARVKETYEGKNFSSMYNILAEHGKISLRRKQLQVAMRGNPKMLIWLGKQILGQKEEAKVEMTGGLKLEGDEKLKQTITEHFAEVGSRLGKFM